MTDLAERRGAWRSSGLRLALWGGLAVLLALPAAAMRLGAEGVAWTASDFIVMGAMLGLAGLGVELIVRASPSLHYRLGAALGVATAFLTVWINLAVGMIGAEDDPANRVFLLVLATALAGTVVAGGRAALMARAMAVTAAAQVLAAATGFGIDPRGATLAALFGGLWLISALLFRKAAKA